MSFLLNTVNKVNETFARAGSFNSEFGMMTGMTPIDILSCNFERSLNYRPYYRPYSRQTGWNATLSEAYITNH